MLRILQAARKVAIPVSRVNLVRRMKPIAPATSIWHMPVRNFSTDLGSMNENEIIELVEGKVFEVLKSAAKCDH